MSGHSGETGFSTSVFAYSSSHGQAEGPGPYESTIPPQSNNENLYIYNGLPGPLPVAGPPHLPQPYPPSFHLDGQPSPRSLYRGEQSYYSSHYQNNRTTGPSWPPRDVIQGINDNAPDYQSMVYPPPNSGWSNTYGGMDMRQLPMPRPPKPKRPRMSLQKRLLVNARERERMRVLNKAFESLRDALPCYIADGHMAKITTLRLAINYIKALTDLLNEQNVLGTMQGNGIRKEKSHEELFSNILKDSRVEGVKPVLKNLDDRLAISKSHQLTHRGLMNKFAMM